MNGDVCRCSSSAGTQNGRKHEEIILCGRFVRCRAPIHAADSGRRNRRGLRGQASVRRGATEAEKGHEKKKKEKGREIKASGCPYGKDKTTGKCYKPREGQFYEDSQGNVHVKETKCVNLPWKPCGGSTPAPAKEKGKEKKSKEKARSGEKGGGKDKAASAKNEKGSEKTSAAKDPAQKSKSPEPRQGSAKPSGAVSAGSEALR